MKTKDYYLRIFLLHVAILIFSFSGVFSKLTANSINSSGLFSWKTILFGFLLCADCGFYALFWQQTIKHIEVNVAYSHKSVYNIWSLIWAYFIFSESITLGNILGTILIIAGVIIIQNE